MSTIPYQAKIRAGKLEYQIHNQLTRLEETINEIERQYSEWAGFENRLRTLTLEQYTEERRLEEEEKDFEWRAAQECRRDAIERDRLGLW